MRTLKSEYRKQHTQAGMLLPAALCTILALSAVLVILFRLTHYALTVTRAELYTIALVSEEQRTIQNKLEKATIDSQKPLVNCNAEMHAGVTPIFYCLLIDRSLTTISTLSSLSPQAGSTKSSNSELIVREWNSPVAIPRWSDLATLATQCGLRCPAVETVRVASEQRSLELDSQNRFLIGDTIDLDQLTLQSNNSGVTSSPKTITIVALRSIVVRNVTVARNLFNVPSAESGNTAPDLTLVAYAGSGAVSLPPTPWCGPLQTISLERHGWSSSCRLEHALPTKTAVSSVFRKHS